MLGVSVTLGVSGVKGHRPLTPELLCKPLFKITGANQAFLGGNSFYAKAASQSKSKMNCVCFSPFVTEFGRGRCKAVVRREESLTTRDVF